MSFWTAAVIIVAIVTFGGVYQSQVKARTKITDERFNELLDRLDRLEERIANL